MERDDDNDDTNNLLLETIRKELVSIIDEGSENIKGCKNKNVNSHQNSTSSVSQCDSTVGSYSQHSDRQKLQPRVCWTKVEEDNEPSCYAQRTSTFLENHNNLGLDDDLQKMHLNLKESYELFQSVGDRFENINFGCLKSRLKDLHLNERNNESIKTIVQDLKNSFDEKYMENRLNDLTKEVSTKFRNHPGEFADIPELSEFFRTCTQLQHGLESLRKQRNDVQDLSKRMTRIAEVSYDRVNEIQQKMKLETNEQGDGETETFSLGK